MSAVRAWLVGTVALCAVSLALARSGNPAPPPPPQLGSRVGFEPRLGAQVPLDLQFRDAHGEMLRFGEALAGRPAVLVPGYYGCTNLCDVVRAGAARAITSAGLNPGEQVSVVLVSIDPRESPADAAAAQRSDALSHPAAHVTRWRYLTGTATSSAALARAIGFRYLFDPRNGQYAHAAGIIVLSPQGTITQYLAGVQFEAATLHLALVQASAGRIGTILDRLVLLCCNYDATTGRYDLLISRVLQGLGLLTLLTLGGLLLALRLAAVRASAGQHSP